MTFIPHRLRSILSAKLGRCPRCMRSSIVGTIIGWPVFAALWLVDPPGPLALLTGLALALAIGFTLLMLAHLGVFTRNVLQTMPGADALGRRQFLSNAVGLGVAVFASALFGPSCRRPSPTEAAAALDVVDPIDGTTIDQTALDQCAICLDECVRIFSSCTEAAGSSEERAECVRVFQRCQERCRLPGRPCFVPVPPPPQRCSPLSGNICDANRANLTPARCQTQCAPGTPECMRVAPSDICRGALQGPVFRRRVGGQELFCQWCACICGTFVPPA